MRPFCWEKRGYVPIGMHQSAGQPQQQQRERRACRLRVDKTLTSVNSHSFRALLNDAVMYHMQQCHARIT
jgi:hypothetical protein